MTKPMTTAGLLGLAKPDQDDLLQKLRLLAQHIDVDPATGVLSVRNGKSRIDLHADGTIRLEGDRIVQTTERDITLSAAWIDLN